MGYELAIGLKDGWIEIEADTPAQLEKRVAALDLKRLEDAIRRARGGPVRKPARKKARKAKARKARAK